MELKTLKKINIKMGQTGKWVLSRIVLLCFHERRLETLFWSCNLFLDRIGMNFESLLEMYENYH